MQPVFFHNALDIGTLAGVAVEAGQSIARAGDRDDCDSLDLFSLSRVLQRAGASDLARATCLQAIARGLPEAVEPQALWQLAAQHKRERRFQEAVETWMKIINLGARYTAEACEELAIYYEHRARDANKALEFAEAAFHHLQENFGPPSRQKRLSYRLERLLRKSQNACQASAGQPQLPQ